MYTTKDHFEDIANFSQESTTIFHQKALKHGEILYEIGIKKAEDFLKGTKSKGLTILDWSFYDESEFTDGTSIKIQIFNPTNKTIKYVWFTFAGYNAVNDKIVDRKRGANITMQGIGPIKPNELGTYNYDYVWFTDLVQTVKIISIKVQYMDGTIKLVTNPKEIIAPLEIQELLFEKESINNEE